MVSYNVPCHLKIAWDVLVEGATTPIMMELKFRLKGSGLVGSWLLRLAQALLEALVEGQTEGTVTAGRMVGGRDTRWQDMTGHPQPQVLYGFVSFLANFLSGPSATSLLASMTEAEVFHAEQI